jgi:hypothetical protein
VARAVTEANQLAVRRNAESDNDVENVHMTTAPPIAENGEDLIDASTAQLHNHPFGVVVLEIHRVDVAGRPPHVLTSFSGQ